jgi:hypothetical protein
MADYDYLFLSLARGPAARTRFIEAVAAANLPAAGARPLGLFTPQLGWEASQAALLVQRGSDGVALAQATAALSHTPEVLACEPHLLRPTIRPLPGAELRPGGIYVHRWFEVDAGSLDTFVALSGSAWPDFEARFDARIFGLFEDLPPTTALAEGRRRLLLITRYGDHGVWEASRDPTTEAMQTFARRAALTLSTRGASTLLTLL